jgi:DNA-directed RNA polymerase subunit H (RpoH/RPB5)
MQTTLRNRLRRRGHEVPDRLPDGDFVAGTCLVVFSDDGSRVGIGVIRDIAKRMEEARAHDAILVSAGLTSSASMEVRKHMSEGRFIVNMTPESLKFDLVDHVLVPPHRVLSAAEKRALVETFGPESGLPQISLDDPVSKYYGVHPGDVFEITRNRPNVGEHPHYRVVVLNE